KLSLKSPDLAHAQVVVPASNVVIQEADVAQDAVYIRDLDGGIGRMRKLSFSGKIESVPLADNKSVSEISFNPTEPGVLIHALSWTNSPLWLGYDPATKAISDTKIQPSIPVNTSGFESVEVKAKSADGTMVPLSIIRSKGAALDGSHPTQ